MEKFIIGIREHSKFGYLPVPLIVGDCSKEFCKIKRIVVFQDVLDEPEEYTQIQKEILSIIDNYSDEKIYSYFNSNKKLSVTQFLGELTEDFVNKLIRPFIEKHIKHLFDILENSDIEIYYKPYRYDYIYFSDKIEMSKEKAQAIFHFDYGEDGIKYYLTVSYKGREIKIFQKKPIILLNKPALIELEHILMYIEEIDANKLKPFYIQQFVSVPKALCPKYFKNFVHKIIRDYNVVATGFEIINASSNKKAELHLEKDWIGEFAFLPKFNYNGKLFKPSDKLENFVTFEEQKLSFTKYSRDFMWELQLMNKLINSGLFQKNDNVYKVNYTGKDKEQQQQQISINWLNDNYEKLESFGFEIIQNFSQKKYFVKNYKLDFKIENRIDWFDIKAIVIIGEFEIPFYKFKNNILEHNNKFELPNGEIFIIPDSWFLKYKNILKYSKRSKNKQLLLNKIHFFALDSIDDIQYEKYDISKLKSFFKNDYKKEIELPRSLKTKLRNYQKLGFAWLNILRTNNFGGILADDMGLGKTVQILTAILSHLQEKKQIFGNQYDQNTKHLLNLVIVPRSLLHNWMNEIIKNTPIMRALLYAGNDRIELRSLFSKVDIIVSSYGIVRNDIDFFKDIDFTYLVLDESQYIKNPISKTYQSINLLKADYKVSLTGTPIENSLKDLWTQLNFVNNGLLGSYSFFKRYFVTPIEKYGDQEAKQELKNIIRPFILRRTKSEVMKDLPEIEENIVVCEMSDEQKIIYEQEKAKVRNKILEIYQTGKLKQSSIYILQALTKLRQIANHPKILNFDYDSGKFEEITSRLKILKERNHKVLIFSSFVSYLELFEEYFKKNKCPYEIITGKTIQRQKAITNFQNNDNINFFLISIKAGGVGINLTAADYVFILDPWWNPAVEQQAIARAHRIGQTKNVFAYKFITYETVEEKILKLQEKKIKLSNEFIDTNNYFKYFSEEAIVDLFS